MEKTRLYELLVEQMNEGVVVVDANEKFTYVNPKFAEILGYENRDELIGKSTFDILKPDELEKVREKNRNRRHGVPESYRLNMMSSHGNPVPVLVSATPIMNAEDEFTGSFAVISDLRHQVKIDKLRIDAEKLRTANQMAVALSHELNNPLTSVLFNIDILEKNAEKLPEDLRISLDIVKKNIVRICDVVEKVQEINKMKTTEYAGKESGMVDILDKKQ